MVVSRGNRDKERWNTSFLRTVSRAKQEDEVRPLLNY